MRMLIPIGRLKEDEYFHTVHTGLSGVVISKKPQTEAIEVWLNGRKRYLHPLVRVYVDNVVGE